MDGLPRKDIPPRLANALLPGNVPPSCRRQRLQVGRTNRLDHEHAVVTGATALLLGQASLQQRASSSLGVNRGGTPALLLGSSAIGLSDATADSVSRAAARSLTPILPPRSSSPLFSQQHGDAVMPAARLQRSVEERRTPVEFADPGKGHGPQAVAAESMALSAPRRTGASATGALRKQLVDGDVVTCTAANRSVRRSDTSSPTDGSAQRAGISKFLQAGSADHDVAPLVDPLQAPYVVHPRMRQDKVDYHSTATITQCPPTSGQYASPGARFSALTRGGLGHASLVAEDKHRRENIHHVHISRRREREARVGDIAREEESKSLRRDVANIKKRATLRQASMAAAAEVDSAVSRRRILTASPSIPAFLPEF